MRSLKQDLSRERAKYSSRDLRPSSLTISSTLSLYVFTFLSGIGEGDGAFRNGRMNSSGNGTGMNPNSHDHDHHQTGNFVIRVLQTAGKLDRVRKKYECPGLFVEFLTQWNEKGGNTESEPGNGLATTTIETFAEVMGKMLGRKELTVSEFICKLNMYGFKHHPENKARKVWNRRLMANVIVSTMKMSIAWDIVRRWQRNC